MPAHFQISYMRRQLSGTLSSYIQRHVSITSVFCYCGGTCTVVDLVVTESINFGGLSATTDVCLKVRKHGVAETLKGISNMI